MHAANCNAEAGGGQKARCRAPGRSPADAGRTQTHAQAHRHLTWVSLEPRCHLLRADSRLCHFIHKHGIWWHRRRAAAAAASGGRGRATCAGRRRLHMQLRVLARQAPQAQARQQWAVGLRRCERCGGGPSLEAHQYSRREGRLGDGGTDGGKGCSRGGEGSANSSGLSLVPSGGATSGLERARTAPSCTSSGRTTRSCGLVVPPIAPASSRAASQAPACPSRRRERDMSGVRAIGCMKCLCGA